MRFAGTRIEGFLGDKPDYGALASGADSLRSKESQAATGLMGKTAAAGISAAGQVKGAEITGAAQQAMASAQSQAATMGMIGQIGGAALGAFGKSYGGFGSTGGTGNTFTSSSISKYGDTVQNPMDSFQNLKNTGPIMDMQVFNQMIKIKEDKSIVL